MSTPKCYEFRGFYDNYLGEDNQTTQAELQDYHDNQNYLMKEVCTNLWQPETTYTAGSIIRSSSMPPGVWAIAISEGTSGEEEPTWPNANTSVSDGSVAWLTFYMKVTVNGIEADENGDIVITKATVGLEHVDNTPDNEKIVAQAGKVGTDTIGGTSQPVYIKDGTPTALSGNIGGVAQPVYMAAGILKALGITIGSGNHPVYIDAGVIKACSTALGAASNGGIIAQSLGTNGYVKFANGLILQWGYRNATNATGEHKGTVWFPISFSSCLNVEATQINPYDSDSDDIWMQVAGISTSSFTYWAQAVDGGCYDGGCYWLAIGIG